MPPNRHASRAVLALAGVVALSIVSAIPAAAAIIGSLTAIEAKPGDRVTLTAQGFAGQTETVYLISTSDFERQIARFGRQVCNTSSQFALGSLTWSGDTSSLTFTVPDVEPGLYYFGVGGVRIEDMVLVTKNGCRNLTKFPKELKDLEL